MTKYCDLHTHSVFSDGTWTPEEIVAEAERLSLSAVALCDHNTTLGLPRFLAAGRGLNVKVIQAPSFQRYTENTRYICWGYIFRRAHLSLSKR